MSEQEPPRRQRQVLTRREAAERLGISKTSLSRRIGAGELQSIPLGARHLVRERTLKA